MLLVLLLTFGAAYFLGSVPTGYLVGKARGVDLRTQGSGNIGATNALRVLGKPAGIAVLLVDACKGALGVTWIPVWAAAAGGAGQLPASASAWLPVVGGIAAVVGHNYTCWLRFKGGKGIATSAGVLAGLVPASFLTVLGVFLASLAVSRIVSLSSLIAAAVLPVATWFWHREPVWVGFTLVLSVFAFVRHRANIARLRAGTEPRIGQVRPQTASPR